jgi:hypothetical protein
MCTASTAKRRRKQARNGYKHIAPLRRPIYHARSADKAARRLAALVAGERARMQRRGSKK